MSVRKKSSKLKIWIKQPKKRKRSEFMEKKVESIEEQLETRHYDIGVLALLINLYVLFQINNNNGRSFNTSDQWVAVFVVSIVTILALYYARMTFSGAFAIVFGFFIVIYLIVMSL
jgi:hypothetical protein